ncbi:MAG TPA: GNAT family N-acetyltransferase [Dehalococcoidales bacterium]|nr:GNAT family N-acetyltransferase [Dehalococcoidales bacterium]
MISNNRDKIAYPVQYETEILLKDGTTILLKPMRMEDAAKWTGFLNRLGPDRAYLKFPHGYPELDIENAQAFCTVDYYDTFAFTAVVHREDEKDLVGVGKYLRMPDGHSAVVALVIEEDYQGRGLGTALMEQLSIVARKNEIDTFIVDVHEKNKRMLNLFRDYGYRVTSELRDGIFHIIAPLIKNQTVTEKEDARLRAATLKSLQWLLKPQSVAVVGASRYPGTIGFLLVNGMVQSGFTGTIYPVNPNAESILNLKAYPSITSLPEAPDMVIIAVPAKLVNKVAEECGHKGVHSLVVISDGFSEIGPEGAAREAELRDIVFGHGMRLIGPNCMGVINTDPSIKMNGTFSPVYPPEGNVAFLSQSGAMGLVVLEYASNLDLGISSFVSIGNRADISSNDLLEYWEQDPATDVVLLYLESFGNPSKFSRVSRRVSKRKPIIAVKGGTTQAGLRAAASHTGAMATSNVISDVLFRNAGIIRVNLMEEMFDAATLLSNQPLPRGRRLVIVTNGGGPGIIAADASARQGLILPQPTPELAAKLKTVIKRDITVHNPIDTTAGATAEEFKGILQILAASQDNDAVLVIFIPPVSENTEAFEKAIRDVSDDFRTNSKPLVTCFLGQRGLNTNLGPRGKSVPSYPFPEEAIVAVARAVEYSEIQRRPAGIIPKFQGIEKKIARDMVDKAISKAQQKPLWLEPQEISDLLACYGIRFVDTVMADSSLKAEEAAVKMGFPVVLKLDSPTITHKSDVGGVKLDLNSIEEVKKAYNDIKAALQKLGRANEMRGVIVQKMIKQGIESIVGVTQDPYFGPVMMFGSGGIYAELLEDVNFKLHPLTDVDARDMISSLKMSKLYQGYRGAPPADITALQDLLLRLSAMVEDLPQVHELDFNPVKVLANGQGYYVVDARISLK